MNDYGSCWDAETIEKARKQNQERLEYGEVNKSKFNELKTYY